MDLTGQRFGSLVALERARKRGGFWFWLVKCDCGTQKEVRGHHLTSGRTISCSCRKGEGSGRPIRHGHHNGNSREYRSWTHMLERCRNPRCHAWPLYGQRGITVCDRWLVFENFLADMGPRPEGRSLDRIDNDRGYEPGNCRWATPKEQANNRGSHPRPVELM